MYFPNTIDKQRNRRYRTGITIYVLTDLVLVHLENITSLYFCFKTHSPRRHGADIQRKQTIGMVENITVPKLEEKALDRNQVFTARQWLERFRQFAKPEKKIAILTMLKRKASTDFG